MSATDFDFSSPDFVASYDELPLWSAACGMLLLDAVPPRPPRRVLDVGCGTGFPLIELAERLGPSSEAHGVDPWEAAVKRARAKLVARGVSHVQVHVGDATDLPFDDGFFDLLVTNLGINNFEDPPAALTECRRVCRPGAELILATNVQGTMAEAYAALERALGDLGLSDAATRVAKLVHARTTVEHSRSLLLAAGFETLRVQESSFTMRFASGAALLRHSFMRLAFVAGWTAAAPEVSVELLAAFERRLDQIAEEKGAVVLGVPIACLTARAK